MNLKETFELLFFPREPGDEFKFVKGKDDQSQSAWLKVELKISVDKEEELPSKPRNCRL
jgi:hypothetical protein